MCELCCDSDWCWNALISLRYECLGPFKDLEDFKTKWDEYQKKEEEKADIGFLERKQKIDEFRENRAYCDHRTDLARKKKNADRNDE